MSFQAIQVKNQALYIFFSSFGMLDWQSKYDQNYEKKKDMYRYLFFNLAGGFFLDLLEIWCKKSMHRCVGKVLEFIVHVVQFYNM